MARKGWDSLSPAYRKRIAAAGMTKEDYERGGSLRKARGHAHTPERPALHDPKKFPQYESKRQQLANVINAKKVQYFSQAPKWNPLRAKALTLTPGVPLWRLEKAAGQTEEQWIDEIRRDPEAWAFLGYH
jgi:hypothetical protein